VTDSKLLEPLAAWGQVEPLDTSMWPKAFVTGIHNEDRFGLRYYWSIQASVLYGRVVFGQTVEGPPGCAHGGSLAAVLDDAMGRCAWLSGQKVVAGKLGITYRKPVRLGRAVTVEARIERVDGRKVHTVGTVQSDDGTLHCEGEGLFIEVDPARFEGEFFD